MEHGATANDLSSASAIGARAAARREELGLTQAELAGRVGVSREWVLRFERGNAGANLGGVLNLLGELGITLNEKAPSISSPRSERAFERQGPRRKEVASTDTVVISSGALPSSPPFVIADSLDRLHGPTAGEVSLPKRLLWNSSRPFDLADEKRARSLLRIVLREARRPEDLEDYVNRDQLTLHWSRLSLPDYISEAWEQKFPELTKAGEFAHA